LAAWVVFVGTTGAMASCFGRLLDVAWAACAFGLAFSQLCFVRLFGSLREASRWWCDDARVALLLCRGGHACCLQSGARKVFFSATTH
jgi:hypothetical protein